MPPYPLFKRKVPRRFNWSLNENCVVLFSNDNIRLFDTINSNCFILNAKLSHALVVSIQQLIEYMYFLSMRILWMWLIKSC